MDVYVFSSNNITNIWAGIGAKMWAVSLEQSENIPGLPDKAQDIPIGAPGIIYCVATQSFTTPFLLYSKPKKNIIVENVWPEHWTLPFLIHPLGTPRKTLHKDLLKSTLPSIMNSSKSWNHILHIAGGTVFCPSHVTTRDWEILLQHLADETD